MKLAITTLALATTLIAACTAGPQGDADPTGQTSQGLSLIDDGPGDDPDSGGTTTQDVDFVCAGQGVLCIAAITSVAPACTAGTATVAGAIACAGSVAGTASACGTWISNCSSRAAQPCSACTASYRCETNGLHCVDATCQAIRGREGQACTSVRDCQAGLTCRNETEGQACWRPRLVGESCQFGDCAFDDGQGHPLTCDANTHQCRRRDDCSTNNTCDIGSHCSAGTCTPGCVNDSQCFPGDSCVAGGCTHTDVVVCNCDGTDAPGTCVGACDVGGGGGGGDGGGGGGGGWGVTCYNFYDASTVCADYGEQHECETTYELVDSFCL